MSWNDLKEAKERSENKAEFVKLKDGESVDGVFVGEPVSGFQKFQDPNFYKNYAKDGRSYKFKVNFVTKGMDGKLVAKIFSGGKRTSNKLVARVDKNGVNHMYTIERTGTGKTDTDYNIVSKGAIPKEWKDELSKVKLHKLTYADEHVSPPAMPANGAAEAASSEAIPF